MFRSATFKLTMYYLLIIAVISLGFSWTVYAVGTNDLAFGLHRQTQRLTTDFPVFNGSPYLRAGRELREGDRRLLGRLLVLNAVVLLIAGWASYALARRTLEPIEAAHERQKRFTADVSHELRTPLTALHMESEIALLDKTAGKNELRAVLQSNMEETDKLTYLIKNLLRLSQLESTNDFTAEIVELDAALSAALQQTAQQAEHKQIILNHSTQPAAVRGELAALTQLLVILLDNAIKYSPANSTIAIDLQTVGSNAEVRITDRGPGIAKQDLEHVFERFYRADSSRTGPQTGYGLGLSIAQLIASAHQATISLTSQPNKGTTAKFTIALAAVSSIPVGSSSSRLT